MEKRKLERMACFCPFLEGDIDCAINIAVEVEESIEYIYNVASEYIKETGENMEDIDIVGCIYDDILQSAKRELAPFELWENKGVDVYTQKNYAATRYDWSIIEPLIDALKKIDISLSKKTIWFLDEVGCHTPYIKN